MGVSFSKVPRFSSRVVYQRELGERAYKVCSGNERATGKNFLREADSETQSDHAMFFCLAVKEAYRRATPPEARCAVVAGAVRNECDGIRRIAIGYSTLM